MSRSRKAAHYGALAERAARQRYDLEPAHDAWHDAEAADGTPVEVKATMLNRASGSPGRFRIFERYHGRLARRDGVYVFVAYRAVGRGIQVRQMRSVEAGWLDVDWYGAGGHRDSRQVKVAVSTVF